MPPQTRPRWHKDYSELKATEKEETQSSPLPSTHLEAGQECVKASPGPGKGRVTTRDSSGTAPT